MATLYLTEQYSRVHKDHETLVVHLPDSSKVTVPLLKVDQVVVMGDITLSGAAIGALLEEGREICFCNPWGRFRGRLAFDGSKNGLLRIEQLRAHDDPARSLPLARQFVRGKLVNLRTLLLRSNRSRRYDALDAAAAALEIGADDALTAGSGDQLFGIEGAASAAYFAVFGALLRTPFQFGGRSRRPPRDPANALLSFGYTVLTNAACSAIGLVGMDPYVGFLHSTQYGKPALALDLIEEFRPLIVDSTVLTVLNKRMLAPEDFTDGEEGVRMTNDARKRYVAALEARLETEVRHPATGKRASYRRCIELQARQIAAVLTSEAPEYIPMQMR